jgi:hypothetical protein
MVLRSNFEIIAGLTFQPYAAEWRIANAETVEWVFNPKVVIGSKAQASPEKTWVRVRIEVSDIRGLENALGLPSFTVLMNRATIPPNLLQSHEDYDRTPDIAGRRFSVLICEKSEFKNPQPDVKPGDSAKNARIMRDEFLNLKADSELGWDRTLRHFLNRWGLWEQGGGLAKDWVAWMGVRLETPGFVLAVPHLLRKDQENYLKSLVKSNAHRWLATHPLSLETAHEWPYYFVRRSYCKDTIEAMITIDHLAERRFGICKRCHNVFQKETLHKKSYCSESCINAAGVQRWRDKQRTLQKKGVKRNAKR